MKRCIEITLFALCAAALLPVSAYAGVTVPEPASVGLMVVGIAGIALVKFRPRK